MGDQLNIGTNLFKGFNKDKDVVVIVESLEFARQHKHHKQKLIFQFAAMRHFASLLKKNKIKVHYVRLTDELSAKSFVEILKAVSVANKANELRVMEAADYECYEMQLQLSEILKIKVEIVDNDLFISTKEDIEKCFKGKKNHLMEHYYRYLRKKHNVLMQADEKPTGGSWNFDKENRKALPKTLKKGFFPVQPPIDRDEILQEVIEQVEKFFPDHYGSSENFNYCVTREQALNQLNFFIDNALSLFGDYQDAMTEKNRILFHSLLSYTMNFGLLHPMQVIKEVEKAYEKKHISLNSVEGFIRQILGWREYIYCIYKLYMPDYKAKNHLSLKRKLPQFMWDGDTPMNCLKHSIQQTIDNAYAHHIQRLMVIGNFCLLAGINPQEVCEWYLIVYVDALEWVELPNTLGMSQYADGGIVGTKPYVSSGNYINRMSDYCAKCHFDVKETLTESACPFNYLYWNFLHQHKELFLKNQRMGIAMSNLARKSDEDIKMIEKLSAKFLNGDLVKPYEN